MEFYNLNYNILDSLTYLCNWLNSDIINNEIAESTDDNDNGKGNDYNDDDDNDNDDDDGDDDNDDDDGDDDGDDILCSVTKLPDITCYYQITYLAD
uniref:ATS domain-containing protein n=1 Tax=Loa loa TaxID=7209 RepID=A0A1I7V8K6_LOALO